MKFLEDDYSQLLSLSSDFLLLEIVTKIVSCLYEAFFTASRQLQATPGKLLMGNYRYKFLNVAENHF